MRRLVVWIWRKRLRFAAVALVFALCLGFADWFVGLGGGSNVYTNVADAPNRPIALVLGTSRTVEGGRMNLFYTPRIAGAAELYHAGKVRAIVVSGDNGSTDYNEPELMKDDLIARGVPAEHITCDYAGFSTLDSIMRIEAVFQEDAYIVVSQEFHVRRALFLAAKPGHDAVGFAVSGPEGYWGTKVRLREVLARSKAFLDVYLFDSAPTFLGPPIEVVKS
jgi:SanA protein